MDIQQIIALVIVAVAAVFLVRQLVASVRSAIQNKAGCGGGCGKCAFAQSDKPARERKNATPGLISLNDIRSLPHKARK